MSEITEKEIERNDLSVWFYTRAEQFINEVIEITEEDFDYALGVVPPIYEKDLNGKRLFGVGEMYSGNQTFWFKKIENSEESKYYGILSDLQAGKEKLSNL